MSDSSSIDYAAELLKPEEQTTIKTESTSKTADNGN
jgi:hypothetical protein